VVVNRGAPFGARGMNVGAPIVRTRFTPGTRAILAVKGATAPPEFGTYTDTDRSDGLVLARKVGYEDWVRRPAATDAMATPPISPTNSTMAR
jgi:hypothetical protein